MCSLVNAFLVVAPLGRFIQLGARRHVAVGRVISRSETRLLARPRSVAIVHNQNSPLPYFYVFKQGARKKTWVGRIVLLANPGFQNLPTYLPSPQSHLEEPPILVAEI